MEHIILVRLDAWLVEGVDDRNQNRHRAGALKEIDHLSKMVLIWAVRLDEYAGNAAADICLHRGFDGSPVDLKERFPR